jgi:hypothetical protein
VEGLLRRIATEKSEAESALRVVAFFDQLVAHRSSPQALVRSSARLIGAPAGYSSEIGGESWGVDASGRPISQLVPPHARTQRVTVGAVEIGKVWILPDTSNHALADLVLERMALSAAIIVGREPGESLNSETATLTRLLDRTTSLEDRAVCAESLRMRPTWRVRAVILKSAGSQFEVRQLIADWARECGIRCTSPIMDEDAMLAVFHDTDAALLDNLSGWPGLVAIGSRVSVLDARESVDSAKSAIRLCSLEFGPRLVDHDSLGALRHIAAVDPEVADNDPLVVRLKAMLESETGRAEVKALDAFCRHTSLRSAAVELNLHHSSLANRLENVSRKLSALFEN